MEAPCCPPQPTMVRLLVEFTIGVAHGQVDLSGSLEQRTGQCPLVLLRQHGSEMAKTLGDPWVHGAERLLPNRQGSPMERLGLRSPALLRIEPGQMLEAPWLRSGAWGRGSASQIARAR